MVDAVKATLVRIDETTSFSLKLVVGVVSLAILVVGAFADLRSKQHEMLVELSIIQSQITQEVWTKSNMVYYVREAALRNPALELPDPEDFSHKE